MSKVRINWPLIATAYASLFCLGILDNIRGPFFPDVIRDLNLTNSQAAFFYAVVSFMAFVTGSIVAKSTLRFGDLVVLRAGQLTMAIGFAFLSIVQTFWQMILACVVFGFGFGILNVAHNILIIDGAAGPIRRRLLSGLHAMYAFSSLMAPLVAAHIFHIGGTWRQGFLYSSILVSISFLVSFLPKVDTHATVAKDRVATKFDQKKIGIAATFLSFYTVAELTVTTRMALYLRDEFHYTAEAAAQELAQFFFGMLIGRLIFLFFHFKWQTRNIVSCGLVATTVCLLLGLFVHPKFLALGGLAISPIFGLAVEYVAYLFPEAPGRAVNHSIAMSCLFIVLMHIVLGVISDRIGVGSAFVAAPIFSSLSLLFLWFSRQYDKSLTTQ